MPGFDIDNFVRLVEANQLDEASLNLSSYFENLSSAEKGKVYVDIAGIYMRMIAENNQRLVDFLDAQLAQLREMDKVEAGLVGQVTDEFELEDIRKKLNN